MEATTAAISAATRVPARTASVLTSIPNMYNRLLDLGYRRDPKRHGARPDPVIVYYHFPPRNPPANGATVRLSILVRLLLPRAFQNMALGSDRATPPASFRSTTS